MLAQAKSKDIYKESWQLLIGVDPLPEELVYSPEVKESGVDIVFASACMIKGHFLNNCYEEMLKACRPNGYIAFTIRDIYLDPATDNGMDYIGKLN